MSGGAHSEEPPRARRRAHARRCRRRLRRHRTRRGETAPQRYTIGLFGDVPYGAQGRAEYPALLGAINDSKVAFSLFDGDLKNGSDRCDDSLYTTSLAAFASLERPVAWVPGDNDWTDCHRASNGGYDPIERLDHERTLFASTDQEIAREDAEHVAREQANIAWLKDAFATAKAQDARAVLVVWQADPNFNNELALKDARSYDGYTAIVGELRGQTLAFAGQVVLVHGDSHYFKVDKPLLSPSGKVLANFTRVETFGSKNTQWVTAEVDPQDPNVFTFRPQIVPANAG